MLENNILYKIYKEGHIPVMRFKNEGFKNYNQNSYFEYEDDDGNIKINEECKDINGCFCLIAGMQDSFILSGRTDLDILNIGYVERDTLIFDPHNGYIKAGEMFDKAFNIYNEWTKDRQNTKEFYFDRNLDDFDWAFTQAVINADDITPVKSYNKDEQLELINTIGDGFFSIQTGNAFIWNFLECNKLDKFQKFINDNELLKPFVKIYFNNYYSMSNVKEFNEIGFTGKFMDDFYELSKKCESKMNFSIVQKLIPDTFDEGIKNKEKFLKFIKNANFPVEIEGDKIIMNNSSYTGLYIVLEDNKFSFYNEKDNLIDIDAEFLMKDERNRLIRAHLMLEEFKELGKLIDIEIPKTPQTELINGLLDVHQKFYGHMNDEGYYRIITDDVKDTFNYIIIEYDFTLNDAVITIRLDQPLINYSDPNNVFFFEKWKKTLFHVEELKELNKFLKQIIDDNSINKYNPDVEDTPEHMQQIQNTYDDFNDTINYLDKLHNLCLPNQLKRIIQDSKDLSNTEKENLINELNTKSIDTIVSDLAVSNVDLLLKFNKIINETEMVAQVIDVRNEILK